MRRKLVLIPTLLFILVQLGFSQDPIFSQFYAAPLQLNPAFTGNTYSTNIALNYRNQWPDIPNAYITYAASVDQFSEDLNSGFGLLVLADEAGDGLLKTNKISGLYSYKIQANRELNFKIGTEFTVVQSKLDWDRLVFRDQLDPEFGPISPGGTPFPTEEVQPDNLTKTYFDFSAGFLAYSKQFYGGISLKHLITPNEYFYPTNNNLNTGLPMRMTIHGGAEFVIVEGNKRRRPTFISPNIMFIKQGDFGQINAGAFGSIGRIFAGAWYRHAFSNPDAAIILVGVREGAFKIGYSYDLTVSGLSNIAGGTGGSHEISFIINFEKPREVDYSDCFGMFR